MKAVNRIPRKNYANYLNFAVKFDLGNNSFSYQYGRKGLFIEDAKLTGLYDTSNQIICMMEDYKGVESNWEQPEGCGETRLSILYSGGPEVQEKLALQFIVNRDGIQCLIECNEGFVPHISGKLKWGNNMEKDTFPVCLNRPEIDLRCAYGPAASKIDNALLDRNSDSVVELQDADQLLLYFDWEERIYRFKIAGKGFRAQIHEDYYKRQFKTKYHPINKNNTFPSPPVGWMTWYSVQFDACENVVLENAAWLKENLADYGANTIWIDWEWYHSRLSQAGPAGVDFFHPDKKRYPNGLAYLASEVKKLGLIPALWIGITNEPALNDFIENNEDAVLAKVVSWCGEYFFDVSNPKFINEYVPAAINMLLKWDYKALKWDCLPITLQYTDQYHDDMMHPEKTSEEALREVVNKAREIVGDDFYMLSCAGSADREVLMAIDMFDGARIGGDIFTWQEFIKDFVARIMKFYSYHNTQIYCDPDNLVIRPEYNTLNQAISRASFVTILGLPITLGDHLPELPEERVELLKRCIPALDIHPMDIREVKHDYQIVLTNLIICKRFEQWNIVHVMNLLEEGRVVEMNILNDLHLGKGDYIVYDFWNHEYLGIFSDTIKLDLRPNSSAVLSVRKAASHPQIVTTSRHISQGAVDLVDVVWNPEKKRLSGMSNVIQGDPYEIIVREPVNGNIFSQTHIPDKTGELRWSFQF